MDTLPPNLRPPLKPLTLAFRDPALEAEYRDDYQCCMSRVVRLSLLLGILLFLFHGVVHPFDDPRHQSIAWVMLAAISVSYVLLLLVSHTRFFHRNMQWIMSCACIAAAAVYAGMVAMRPHLLAQEYVGFILIMLATYTVLALQFVHAFAIFGVIGGLVMAIVFACPEPLGTHADVLLYLATALALVTVGSWNADRQRRVSFHIRKQLEREQEEVRAMAMHDSLTGLPNRRLLADRLRKAVLRNRRHGSRSVLMFLDLDGFKQVNDTLGHDAGDALLVEVAERLRGVARESDTLARMGGDEFIVLFEDFTHEADARTLAERILHKLEAPVVIHGNELQISASIGIAMHPGDGDGEEELVQAADAAMYEAKHQGGRRYALFQHLADTRFGRAAS